MKRAKNTFTEAEQTEITNIQKSTGVARKTAIKRLRANQKGAARLRERAERNTLDFESAAANDKTETTPKSPKPEPKQIAQVMKQRGISRKSAQQWLRKHAAVIVADGGLDEIVAATPEQIAEGFENNVAPEVTAAVTT
jgi:hypothetical protein